VFALIEQLRLGCSSPAVAGSLIAGVTLFPAFLLYGARARDPMLKLDLFNSRNFAVGRSRHLRCTAGCRHCSSSSFSTSSRWRATRR
jgi:hypothetical protein